MVVMVILGIIAGAATPTVGRIFDNLKYRRQVRKYSSVLRYANLLAVSHGEWLVSSLPKGMNVFFN